MTSVPSATTWGSPTATKHVLLIHGLTSSSHTWHGVASAFAAQGYFVTAPNLIGHGSRVAIDYSLTSIAEDLRPYLEARNYSLIIGHSLGALTALALTAHLPPEHPTAIILVDPPLEIAAEKIPFFDNIFSESCANLKQADSYSTENPLWKHEDCIARELGTRLCFVDTVHGVFEQNNPWNFLDYLKATSNKWFKVTAVLADPAIIELCPVKDLEPHPHIRHVIVPGAGHWVQLDAPDVVIEEALKTVAELETR
ncbi:Alpha/Beta hydrolase protein [Boletus edulis]|nr:Alpha/Beta hydrolase protein [Boletus edulis]KAF8124824.1 Alpha/Beta hydrolase protein [Boletus edulis]